MNQLVNLREVARQARLSVRTVQRMVGSGAIPQPVKVGTGRRRLVRFRASDVDLWITLGCPDRATFEAAKRQSEGVPT